MELSIGYCTNPPCIKDPVHVWSIDGDYLDEEGIITKIIEFDVAEIWLPKRKMILTLEINA